MDSNFNFQDKEELFESLFTEDQDTGFDDDRSPKETSDLAALEEILDTEVLSKDVLADYERRPKEDESSNGEFAGIPINNDEATHKEQGHRRQDERRTSAGETPLNNNINSYFC